MTAGDSPLKNGTIAKKSVRETNRDHRIGRLLLQQYCCVGALFILLGYSLNYFAKTELSPDSDLYISIAWTHGTMIVFLGIVPVLFAGLGYFLLAPIDSCAASPRWLSMAGLGLYYLSAIFLIVGLLNPQSPFLMLAMAMNCAFGSVCSWIFIVTVAHHRMSGVRWWQMRSVVWTLLATAIFIFLDFLLLEFAAHKQLLGSFVAASRYSLPPVDVSEMPRWLYHLFWFMGHPEVFVIFLPILGLAMDGMRAGLRKLSSVA